VRAALVFGILTVGAASARASTVDDHLTTDCSTDVVLPLSTQVAGEVSCLLPGQLSPLQEGGGIVFTGTVLPWLDAGAEADLATVAAAGEVDVNSGYRTVVQQYLIYRWWQAGRCGISAAATPGDSNHESARAVDLQNWDTVLAAMDAHGWSHDVPGDDVHFDHLASPDIRGSDVQAFQHLWNVNHPDMLLTEDGVWGPMTESALGMSPAEGFATGPDCASGIPTLPVLPRGDDPTEPPSDAVGGCSTGGGGSIVLAGLLCFSIRNRRRPLA
jgi:hypothetical protein